MANWFVAWPVSAGSWYAVLCQDPPRAARLFHPDDLHVTAAFLGAVGEERARSAYRAGLAAQAGGDAGDEPAPGRVADRPSAAPGPQLDPAVPPPSGVRATSMRWLGGRRPTAVSMLLEAPDGSLRQEMDVIRRVARRAAGLAEDPRPALPHVTVARVGRRTAPRERLEIDAWMARLVVPEHLTLGGLCLYTRSDSGRTRFRIVDGPTKGFRPEPDGVR